MKRFIVGAIGLLVVWLFFGPDPEASATRRLYTDERLDASRAEAEVYAKQFLFPKQSRAEPSLVEPKKAALIETPAKGEAWRRPPTTGRGRVEVAPPPTEAKREVRWVKATRLNLRAAPTAKGQILGKLRQNTKLTVLRTEGRDGPIFLTSLQPC